jgi:molybdopterin-containing oxidoreductase family membrane subunit
LNLALALVFSGVWIEKGMGLIIPGFVPSTLHELVEYHPTLTEWKVTVGLWAVGMMVFTIALKVALPIFGGEVGAGERSWKPKDASEPAPAE